MASPVNWITRQIVLCVTLTILSLTAVAEVKRPDVHQHYTFDLPQQSVADSLNDLAKHTGAQFLFPFQLAQSKTAKPISGHFTLLEATAQLLQNTGLRSDLVDGVLTISPAEHAGTFGNQNHKGKKMNTYTRKTLLASMVGLFAAGGASGSLAQGGEAATEQGRIDEIIVTATKRETSLQDTALSVSAITGDDLSKLGVTNFHQILAAVPGATVIDGGEGSSRVSYRGIATNGVAEGNAIGNDTTSTYIDEFPLAVGDIAVRLVDMEQVEVLKGPQGTLYGQSALGGVMRFITNKPNVDALEGNVTITHESVADGNNGYQAQGYLNIPLSNDLAVRGVFYNFDRPGFINNLGTGSEDVNTSEVTGGRLAVGWEISKQVAFNLLYLNQTSRDGGGQSLVGDSATSTYTPVSNGLPTDVMPPDLENPSYLSNFDSFYDRDFEALNLKFDVNFEHFDLSLMGAKKEIKQLRKKEMSVWFALFDAVTSLVDTNAIDSESKTFEGRLVSNGNGPVEWIAGIWYEKEDRSRPWPIVVRTPRTDLELFGVPMVDGDFIFDRDRFHNKEEVAIYGEVGYKFSDQSKLTLGYRRADLKLDSGLLRADGVFDGGAAASIGVDESTQEDIDTYKIHFEHRVNDDLLAYALASSGYRAGGWNRTGTGQVSAASPYGTDTLWNYEVGVRTSWLDNRLIANAVAYYIDWSDIQLRAWDIDAQTQKIQNAGNAENFGFETEIRYQVTDSLQLSANYSYIDASMAEDFIDGQLGTVIAAKGSRLPGSSKNAFSLFVDWQHSLGTGLELLVNADYRYVSSRPNVFGIGTGLSAAFPDDLPSAEVVNLSTGVRHDNGVTASLFANNLFDERSIQQRVIVGAAAAGLEANTISRPRTIGVRVGYQF